MSAVRTRPAALHRSSLEAALPSAAGVLVALADVLLLLGLPWYLMQAFRSLDALTLKAAWAGTAMAAAVLGEWSANHLRRTGRLTVLEAGSSHRVLLMLAVVLAVLAGGLAVMGGNSFLNVPVVTVGAYVTFFLAAIALPTPFRSFPFGPRGNGARSLGEIDRYAFGAVLAALILTVTGPAGEFLVAGVVYAAVALLTYATPDAAAWTSPDPRPAPARALPPFLDHTVDRVAKFLGAAGLRQAPNVAVAATIALQVLFGLAVYKIKVHMEFSALALGMLLACGGAGEFLGERALRWVNDSRTAAVGMFFGALFTVGMFAGLAGNAFPPLVFVFWAGVCAAAHWMDRLKVHVDPDAGPPQHQRLRLLAIGAITLASYLVWWISTWLARPHSINLVLTLAGAMVAARICWALLPSATGVAGDPPVRTPVHPTAAD